jgi:hypothetical protein
MAIGHRMMHNKRRCDNEVTVAAVYDADDSNINEDDVVHDNALVFLRNDIGRFLTLTQCSCFCGACL